jgi:flavodoxin I
MNELNNSELLRAPNTVKTGGNMTKTIIVYGSTTGSTLKLAERIEDTLKIYNGDVERVEVTDIQPADLTAYDLIILGCSTWGEGELQEDFVFFEEEMEGLDLTGKLGACFGPGDSDYTLFCEAVNILEGRLDDCGAKIIATGLKIDGDVDSQLKEAEKWAEKVFQSACKVP